MNPKSYIVWLCWIDFYYILRNEYWSILIVSVRMLVNPKSCLGFDPLSHLLYSWTLSLWFEEEIRESHNSILIVLIGKGIRKGKIKCIHQNILRPSPVLHHPSSIFFNLWKIKVIIYILILREIIFIIHVCKFDQQILVCKSMVCCSLINFLSSGIRV